ncbi:MAG: hypothetical protein LBG43_04670 [Treponema sp.]|nr:hypothetical protein [Treponema sp.]
MKKIIAFFVALAVFSSAALFAVPVSGAPGAAARFPNRRILRGRRPLCGR